MIIRKNNFDISNISYIKVGGIVKEYIIVDNIIDLINLKIKKFICIGNTSKILFCFNYTKKTFLKFNKNGIIFYNNRYFIYSGTSLSYCYQKLKPLNISGFEYLSTIPGLIGGSVVNNASFLNQCISDNIIRILVYDKNEFYWIYKNECSFSYRNSNLRRNNFIIIGVEFNKIFKHKNVIENDYNYALEYRKKYQNEFNMTLGSTFKNPINISIGKVLDQIGFKNYIYTENVRISRNHANFIIIEPKTNYLEIYTFINFLKKVLYNYLKTNVELEIIVIYAE